MPATVAGNPSPETWQQRALPANVVIVPEGSTLRTTWLDVSAMYRLPLPSSAMPCGVNRSALVAAAPSPAYPAKPVPATVVIVPSAATLRIRLLLVSAMYVLPALSRTTPHGALSQPSAAGPPSLRAPPTSVVSATLVAFRMRFVPFSAMYRLPDPSTATPYG